MEILSIRLTTAPESAVIIAEGQIALTDTDALAVLARPGAMANPEPYLREYFLRELRASVRMPSQPYAKDVELLLGYGMDILACVLSYEQFTGFRHWNFSILAVTKFTDITESNLKSATLPAKER